jgi:hypothetical protein
MDINYNQYYPHWIEEFKRCADWIEGALQYSNGDFDLKDIADGINRGEYILWTCPTAALVTQFLRSNKQTTIHLFLAGGAIDGVEQLVRECEEWAKSVGCNAMTLTGREGWKKSFLKPMGFEEVSINMFKKLE